MDRVERLYRLSRRPAQRGQFQPGLRIACRVGFAGLFKQRNRPCNVARCRGTIGLGNAPAHASSRGGSCAGSSSEYPNFSIHGARIASTGFSGSR
jgi:hypothetical protein